MQCKHKLFDLLIQLQYWSSLIIIHS